MIFNLTIGDEDTRCKEGEVGISCKQIPMDLQIGKVRFFQSNLFRQAYEPQLQPFGCIFQHRTDYWFQRATMKLYEYGTSVKSKVDLGDLEVPCRTLLS